MTEAIVGALQRAVLQAGTLVLVGAAVWRLILWPRLRVPVAAGAVPEGSRGALAGVERRVARFATAAVLVVLGAWALRFYVQLAAFRDKFVPLGEDVSFLLKETFWGTVWLTQGGVLLLLLVMAGLLTRRGANPTRAASAAAAGGVLWWAFAVCAILLVLTLALSSHALSVDGSRALAVTADAAHALAAGAWLGSLTLLLATHRGREEGAGPLFAAQLRVFSPLAVVCVTMLVVMGVYLSWQYLTAPADLWRTAYGRILGLKVLVAGIVLAMGFLNWRRGMPQIETEAARAAVRRRAAWEIAAAVVVLALTGVLTGSSRP